MKVWIVGCTATVFGMVVVGGLTRLTESGLSMVLAAAAHALLFAFRPFLQRPLCWALLALLKVLSFSRLLFTGGLGRVPDEAAHESGGVGSRVCQVQAVS